MRDRDDGGRGAVADVFGDEAGRWFQELLESKGVEIHAGETLDGVRGRRRGSTPWSPRAGKTVEGDFVVVGAGVKPDTMLAQRAGLEVDDGIVCDATLQTSVEGIYAAGDVCSYDSVVHGRRLRVEHWDVAMQQGHARRPRHARRRSAPYDVVPYFFSDLADWAALEYVGPAADWDEEIWRGDRDAGEFSVFYLEGRQGRRVPSVGRSEDLGHARELLAKGVDVSGTKDALADADSDLSRSRRLSTLSLGSRSSTVRPGVMATRRSLEAEFGVRVPGAAARRRWPALGLEYAGRIRP